EENDFGYADIKRQCYLHRSSPFPKKSFDQLRTSSKQDEGSAVAFLRATTRNRAPTKARKPKRRRVLRNSSGRKPKRKTQQELPSATNVAHVPASCRSSHFARAR